MQESGRESVDVGGGGGGGRACAGPVAVAVVVSRYNSSITDVLLAGALSAYGSAGGDPGKVRVIDAPGAFELPVLAESAARTGRYGAIVALGCVIKGDTRHDEYINHAVAHGLTDVATRHGLPVAFGVLTVENVEQAWARAGGEHGNKGAEAMESALLAAEQIAGLVEGDGGGRGDGVVGGVVGVGRRPDKTVV